MNDQNVCEFCGQVLLDGRECNCPGAQEKREIERQINNAKRAIKRVFVDSLVGDSVAPTSEEAMNLMELVVVALAYEFIEKASIVLPGGIKANLSKKSSAIKVERVETIKSSMEA